MCSREWIVHAYQNESESARCDPDTNEIKNGWKGKSEKNDYDYINSISVAHSLLSLHDDRLLYAFKN